LKYNSYFQKSICRRIFAVLAETIGLDVSEISCADHELEDWTHGEEEEEKEDLVISRKRGCLSHAGSRPRPASPQQCDGEGPEKIKRPARAPAFFLFDMTIRGLAGAGSPQAKRISRPGANW
jgi:hypothetical protein